MGSLQLLQQGHFSSLEIAGIPENFEDVGSEAFSNVFGNQAILLCDSNIGLSLSQFSLGEESDSFFLNILKIFIIHLIHFLPANAVLSGV